MLALLLVLVGVALAAVVAPGAGRLERWSWRLLFTLTAVPFVAFHVALLRPAFLGAGTLWASGLVMLAVLVPLAARRGAPVAAEHGTRLTLSLGAVVGVLTALHHTDTELWLQLGSYLGRGEAECFYMQTFSFVPELNPDGDPQLVRDAYDIISTPGNAVFTAGWLPVLGDHAFRFLHAAVVAVGFLFTTLLLRRWTNLGAATLAALALYGNPWLLSIEVLDRNVLTLALSPALLWAVLEHPRKPVLHGWLLALVAGSGLRFLPLVFVVPVAAFYLRARVPLRTWAVFGAAAALCFAFNLPHLGFHGFHSLGETQPLPALTSAGLTRTPWVPHPTAVLYLRWLLSALGGLGAGLVLAGLDRELRVDRWRTAGLAVVVAAVFGVLALQRDWIESDKARIFVMAGLPFAVWFASGVVALGTRRGLALLAVGAVAAPLGDRVLAGVEGHADDGLYERKPLYQHERPAYVALSRARFGEVGLLPDYARLFDKLDWSRKRDEARVVAETLFGADPAGHTNPWIARWVDADQLETVEPTLEGDFVDLTIDLEQLGVDPASAVRVAAAGEGRVFLDLSRPERLVDVYFKEVDVSWQHRQLTVTALPLRDTLGEVHLDLNAFAGFGADAVGFQQVNLVQLEVLGQREAALATAMTALPQADDDPTITLRVRADQRVLLRNWFVNVLKGTPQRVDGWVIEAAGEPEAQFFYGEPESYL